MKDRGPFIVLVVVILSLAIFISISFFQPPKLDNTGGGKTVLRISGYGGYSEEEYLKEVKEKFERLNPDIKLVIEIAPTSIEDMQFTSGFIPGYEHRILSDFAANDPPDVFYVPEHRYGLYRDSKALLNMKPNLAEIDIGGNNKELFSLRRGSINLGVSSKTKYPEEASKLVYFIYTDYEERLKKIQQEALEKAKTVPLSDSGLTNNEIFQENWNAFAVMMNRSDLVLWTAPDKKPLYWGFRIPGEPYDHLFVNLSYQSDEFGIVAANVSLLAKYAYNSKLISEFRTCMEILMRAVDPSLTSERIYDIFEDLGFDFNNFNLKPFHMIGSVYYNGFEYSTSADPLTIEQTTNLNVNEVGYGDRYSFYIGKQGILRFKRGYPSN